MRGKWRGITKTDETTHSPLAGLKGRTEDEASESAAVSSVISSPVMNGCFRAVSGLMRSAGVNIWHTQTTAEEDIALARNTRNRLQEPGHAPAFDAENA